MAATGAARLRDLERYLRAAARRLERLPDVVAGDRDRMRAVHELEEAYEQRLAEWPRGRPLPAGAARPALGARGAARQPVRAGRSARAGPVSAKRIRRVLDETVPA